jgi:hypothetical protein
MSSSPSRVEGIVTMVLRQLRTGLSLVNTPQVLQRGMLTIEDLKKMNKVTVDKASMTCTAGGGCRAIDLETPLQGMTSGSHLKSFYLTEIQLKDYRLLWEPSMTLVSGFRCLSVCNLNILQVSVALHSEADQGSSLGNTA